MKKIFLLFIVFFTLSCAKDDTANYDAQNEADILSYLESNNLTAQKTSSGLYYLVKEQNGGNYPVASSNVTVTYKGYFLNGSVFDQNLQSGISFNLNQVIDGWKEGLTYYKEGGKGTLFVPSRLGYGNQGNSRIPGGSVILFDIKLIKINR